MQKKGKVWLFFHVIFCAVLRFLGIAKPIDQAVMETSAKFSLEEKDVVNILAQGYNKKQRKNSSQWGKNYFNKQK